MDQVISKHGIPIRLTDERWVHITEEHCELAGLRAEVLETVFQPERIVAGAEGERLAVRQREPEKHLGGGLSRAREGWLCDHGVSHEPDPATREEEATMAITDIQDYLKLIPAVTRAPEHAVWMSYDPDADTLYVNFKKPSYATDSEMTDEDIIVRYAGEDVIGFTVLHASARLKKTEEGCHRKDLSEMPAHVSSMASQPRSLSPMDPAADRAVPHAFASAPPIRALS